jgi:hypothetical protein
MDPWNSGYITTYIEYPAGSGSYPAIQLFDIEGDGTTSIEIPIEALRAYAATDLSDKELTIANVSSFVIELWNDYEEITVAEFHIVAE